MIISEIYIGGFGKLMDFRLRFNEGLNEIVENNGYGKIRTRLKSAVVLWPLREVCINEIIQKVYYNFGKHINIQGDLFANAQCLKVAVSSGRGVPNGKCGACAAIRNRDATFAALGTADGQQVIFPMIGATFAGGGEVQCNICFAQSNTVRETADPHGDGITSVKHIVIDEVILAVDGH